MTSHSERLAALSFLYAIGVDQPVEPEPVDRRRRPSTPDRQPETAERPPVPPAHPSRTAPASGLLGSGDASMEAREQAAGCRTLEELREMIATFEGCALKASATNLVFADGNPQGPVMVVGEAPGREEDLKGLPFVGESGQLLDRMLQPLGLDRGQVYISNILPWRPPGNRKPTAQEIMICLPFIRRHIELAAPEVLVLAGGTAVSALLQRSEGITRLRGRWYKFDAAGREVPTMATFHPAYLLRQPAQKREAWRDWLAVRRRLVELAAV